MNPLGIYVHIPFCKSKCPYCDFYSLRNNELLEENYTNALIKNMDEFCGLKADTLYIGGGTPSCINPKNLVNIISNAKRYFCIENSAEITVECNPSSNLKEMLPLLAKAGVNRISMGLQSAVDEERKKLGRIATPNDVKNAIELAKNAGIENISLDLMLGIPNQTEESLKRSIDFCANSGVTHISAYILKIEENTHFYKVKESLNLPNEDETSELYLMTCEQLEKSGFNQYEISNFAKAGFESKHNIKYWNCDEYLGFGASAHSFYKNKRFYYDRDIDKYINCPQTAQDGSGGDFNEYLMMRLRLKEGLENKATEKRFGHSIPERICNRAGQLEKYSLLVCDDVGIRLTTKGFLLSNSIISELLY